MQIRELSIQGAWEVTPMQREDDRGLFLEWYRFDHLEAVLGHVFTLRQANTSISRRGVVRGIHFADVPKGQAKYVTVAHGAVLDFVVDVREGSPTFGSWDSVILDDIDRRAIYLAEGLGHAFVSLSDTATVTYLVSETYDPAREHAINALDPEIGLAFPIEVGLPRLSPKDEGAPSLAQAVQHGILPNWASCVEYYDALSTGGI